LSLFSPFLKKEDLSDCNNYRGISLINVGLKIISKIITDRISNYALSHNFIRPEQFGFRNHEECISLFITIREICQKRKFHGKFTYIAFLDLKKAYDSVPIFNILTKLYHLGIRGKCFDFLSNLYLSSKARAKFLDMLSDESRFDYIKTLNDVALVMILTIFPVSFLDTNVFA